MRVFFLRILIYYSFIGFLVGSNLIKNHSGLSNLSFLYGAILLFNIAFLWKYKEKRDVAYFIWFFSSLIFWISCLWYTGNLGSPLLFFVFLLPFFNTILKGVKHFYLTLFQATFLRDLPLQHLREP